MTMISETQYASGNAVRAYNPDRLSTYKQDQARILREKVDQHGIVFFVDSLNKMDEAIATSIHALDHVDLMIEVIQEFLDERYPSIPTPRKAYVRL